MLSPDPGHPWDVLRQAGRDDSGMGRHAGADGLSGPTIAARNLARCLPAGHDRGPAMTLSFCTGRCRGCSATPGWRVYTNPDLPGR